MNFETMIREIGSMGLQLYDFALYTPSGIYAHRFSPSNRCNNSYSVAKVFVVTAVGLLWQEGKLDVSQRLCELLPGAVPPNADPQWREVTVENALKHTLGFDHGFLDIDEDDMTTYESEDFLHLVFSQPLPHPAGEQYQYTDAAYYLLSRVVSRLTGEEMDSFIKRRILNPLRVKEAAWTRCPLDHVVGATGLYMSAEDVVKIGALYMNGGVWAGRRLLSSEWVELVLERCYELKPMTPEINPALIGKRGMFGQGVAFNREKGFAVAWHGFNEDGVQTLIDYLGQVE